MRISFCTIAFTFIAVLSSYVSMAQRTCKVPETYLGNWHDNWYGFDLQISCDSAIVTDSTNRLAFKILNSGNKVYFYLSLKEIVTIKLLGDDVVSLIYAYTDNRKIVGVPIFTGKYQRKQ